MWLFSLFRSVCAGLTTSDVQSLHIFFSSLLSTGSLGALFSRPFLAVQYSTSHSPFHFPSSLLLSGFVREGATKSDTPVV